MDRVRLAGPRRLGRPGQQVDRIDGPVPEIGHRVVPDPQGGPGREGAAMVGGLAEGVREPFAQGQRPGVVGRGGEHGAASRAELRRPVQAGPAGRTEHRVSPLPVPGGRELSSTFRRRPTRYVRAL